MAVNKYITLLYTFSCFCCGLCQLNLSEGAPCITYGKNGNCVRLFRCGSAVLTYLYRNSGFLDDKYIPPLPEICSYKNSEPIVCCTDCSFSENDVFKDSAIAPHGILVSRRGPKAWGKCLDYFQRLPYPCSGKGEVFLKKQWVEFEQCYNATLSVKVAVGGHVSQAWKFPHLALLGYGETTDTAQWLCEGTIISEKFILTAAHCTNAGIFGTIVYAALGQQSQDSLDKQWNIYNVKRIIIHPNYNEPSLYHDLALVEMETDIRFDKDILPACLDVGIHGISVAEVAGTTYLDLNSTKPVELETIFLDRMSRLQCTNIYRPDYNLVHGYDHRTQVCYSVHNSTDHTCKRISGSPVQIDQFRCQYTVVGVTGIVEQCGRPDFHSIYTKIQYYVPWIESIVWPDED